MTTIAPPSPPTNETIDLGRLKNRIVDFLEHYWGFPLIDMGGAFARKISGRTGQERFASLLRAFGFADDANGFLKALSEKLQQTNADDPKGIAFNGIELPYNLLLAALTELMPEIGYRTVKKVKQLEELLSVNVPESDRAALQQVLDTYPVRLSWHVLRQMRLSHAIGYQYRPFLGELDNDGEVHTWVGQFHRGIVEQMYQNRVIFIMNMACPVYCRFCFRKHKECRNQRAPTKAHVKQDIAYLREMSAIEEIVLTGGDPFMNKATLQFAVAELAKIPHIQTLRLASRGVSYFPQMFLRDDEYWLNYLVRTNLDFQHKDKRLELATHFIHPDEISVDALHIITHLTKHGVPVYVQTPFVNGCNESGKELVELFSKLRAAGAEIHYIFMPTSPIQGNKVYWAPISDGLAAGRYLRAHLSDRAIPHLTTATGIGKIDWNSSGWAVERHESDPRYVWLRTPYTTEYYQLFAPIMQVSNDVRHNTEGTLDARFFADIGDEDLLAGPRGLTSSPEAHQYKLQKTQRTVGTSLEALQQRMLDDQRLLDYSLDQNVPPGAARVHKTRLEIDCDAWPTEHESISIYVAKRPEITEVVLSRQDGLLSALSQTLEVVKDLQQIPHLSVFRLRCLEWLRCPEAITRPVISRMAARSRLSVVRSKRLEIETQVLHASELGPDHGPVVRQLRMNGIFVYNNTPLLGYINDNEEECFQIALACRRAGIEFCQIVVAGLPIQDRWNRDAPIEANSVIDIATYVRRNSSGRAIPRYVIRTRLGEIDFGIVPRVFFQNGEVWVKMRPHDLSFFRAIDPNFAWPDDIRVDSDGHPLVSVSGLSLENQQFLFSA